MLKIKPIKWGKFCGCEDECYDGEIIGEKISQPGFNVRDGYVIGKIEFIEKQNRWLVDMYFGKSVWADSFGDAIKKGQEILENFIKSCIEE